MNSKKIQRTATGAKFGRIIWQALHRMMLKSAEQIILYIAETQSRNTENYWYMMVSEAIYTMFGPAMKIIIQYNKKKKSSGNGAFLHLHLPAKTKRKQEKTGQIDLGNNSMPLLWAQQFPQYEQ